MGQVFIDVPKKLFAPAESSSFSGEFDVGVLTAGPDVYDFKKPLSWDVVVSNTGDGLLVTGTVQGAGQVACSRCLKVYDQPVVGDVEGFFLLPDKPVPQDMEGDEYQVMGDDDRIDIAPILEQAVRVDLPLVPLHSEDCKGLCPVCGQDLNEGSCDCAEKAAAKAEEDRMKASPFAALAGLEVDGADEDAPEGADDEQGSGAGKAASADDGAAAGSGEAR